MHSCLLIQPYNSMGGQVGPTAKTVLMVEARQVNELLHSKAVVTVLSLLSCLVEQWSTATNKESS